MQSSFTQSNQDDRLDLINTTTIKWFNCNASFYSACSSTKCFINRVHWNYLVSIWRLSVNLWFFALAVAVVVVANVVASVCLYRCTYCYMKCHQNCLYTARQRRKEWDLIRIMRFVRNPHLIVNSIGKFSNIADTGYCSDHRNTSSSFSSPSLHSIILIHTTTTSSSSSSYLALLNRLHLNSSSFIVA